MSAVKKMVSDFEWGHDVYPTNSQVIDDCG